MPIEIVVDLRSVEKDAIVAEKYRLVRRLGAGGMGEVWEATHTVTAKRVAIKVLNSSLAHDKNVRTRFLNEARAACRVRHPNIVQVHDVLELPDGAPAMVMDFLDGESLGQKLEREGSIPLGELAKILGPIARAIAAAHALGIVHRDLKPDNLYVERQGDESLLPKVLDFGIAKVAPLETDNADNALTRTGAFLGTPYYVSPEQAFGEKDLDHRSDVWSLGIIVYECLAGRRPTEADNFGQILKTITTGLITPLGQLRPDLPPDITELVGRMLTVDRAKRPDLVQVAQVLERHAANTSMLARSVVAPTGVSALAADGGDALAPTALGTPMPENAPLELAPTLDAPPVAPASLGRTDGNMGASQAPVSEQPRRLSRITIAAALAIAAGITIVGYRQTARTTSPTVSSTTVEQSAAPPPAAIESLAAPIASSPPIASAAAFQTAPAPSASTRHLANGHGPVPTQKVAATPASASAATNAKPAPAPSGSVPSVAKLNEAQPF